MPGLSPNENMKFRPFGVLFTQPTRCCRYQFTSAGSRVSKLYWMSQSGSTPLALASVTQESPSLTLYGRPPAGVYAGGSDLAGLLSIMGHSLVRCMAWSIIH